jgi:hypothetical protein
MAQYINHQFSQIRNLSKIETKRSTKNRYELRIYKGGICRTVGEGGGLPVQRQTD